MHTLVCVRVAVAAAFEMCVLSKIVPRLERSGHLKIYTINIFTVVEAIPYEIELLGLGAE